MTDKAAPPTFIYAGPPKSGSSWLAKVLSEHPDVFVPAAKDVKYFNSQYHRPISWYYGFFAGRGRARQAGEVCHNYFEHPLAAERIHKHLPDVKLIFTLRDPVERARSHWLFERAMGVGQGMDFAAFCRRPDIVAVNDYAGNLGRYYDRFPSAQIRVFFYRQIRQDPAAMMREVFQFLGVDPEFVPPSLHKRVLPTDAARSPYLAAAAWHVAQWMRNRGGANVVGWLKSKTLLQTVLFRPLGDPPGIPSPDMERFFDEQRGMYPALGRLIGQELPALWHVPPSKRASKNDNAENPRGQRPTLT